MYDIEKITVVRSVSDAVKELCADPDALIIAGGSDVLIKIREGKAAGCRLVSIREIDALRGIKLEDDGTIWIGPLTTFSELTESPIIQKYIPVLGFAADQIGGPQIRNIGTVGGNISNGVTSADTASTLCAFNAIIEISGSLSSDAIGKSDNLVISDSIVINDSGCANVTVRNVSILDYYVKAGKVCLQVGELCTAIRIRKADYDGYKGCYIKFAMRNAMDIATLGCSVVSKTGKSDTGDAVLEDVRIAFGVAGPVPMRCVKTEDAVRGMKIDKDLFSIIEKNITEDVNPRTSWRASKEFRLQLAHELPVRALKETLGLGGQHD